MMRTFQPFTPDSMMWKINRERVVLLAGPAAAVLQVAHPQVARGVAAHSNFREDPAGRLARTLSSVYLVAFGTGEEVERVRLRVGKMHAAVRGGPPNAYSAMDEGAQLWVMATLIQGSVSMFERFVRILTLEEKNLFLFENRQFGEVFGMPQQLLPGNWADFSRYFQAMLEGEELGSDALCKEVATAVVAPVRPWAFRIASPLWHALAAGLIPDPLRTKLGLQCTSFGSLCWKGLDALLPRLLPAFPDRLRFAPEFLRARKRR